MSNVHDLARLGWSIIPLGDIKVVKNQNGDEKKDIVYPVPWKQYQTDPATDGDIAQWEERGFTNWGVVTGRVSNIFVLDVDEYKETFDNALFKSLRIPVTPTQLTARGGKQFFFKWPQGLELRNNVNIGTKDSGMDVRGEGGMCIIPPTKTSYGEYTWLIPPGEEDFADVPQTLLNYLITEKDASARVRKNLQELVGLREGGGRNNAVAIFTGKLVNATPWTSWDSEVWPAVQILNASFNPPLDSKELRSVYESITKIAAQKLKEETKPTNPEVRIKAKTFRDIITTEYPESRFSISPFFEQGTLNMVSAPPNTYKSWMFLDFAYCIAKGKPYLGVFPCEKTGVMIVNEEDTERLLSDRFKLLDITDEELPIYFHVAEGGKVTDEYCTTLTKECAELGVTVVMFDSLRAIHDADENSSTAMQPVMDAMKILTRAGITVLFTHHHKKRNQFDKPTESEASRGSSAINAAVSGHISLEELQTDNVWKKICVRHLKSKVTQKIDPFEIKITTDQESGRVTFEYLGELQGEVVASMRARDVVTTYLKKEGRWVSVGDIVKETGVFKDDRYIRKALKLLCEIRSVDSTTRSSLDIQFGQEKFSGAKNTKYYKWSKDAVDDDNKDSAQDNIF